MITYLTDIVRNAAEKFPQREAFTDGKTSISYVELNHKTSQLAGQLLRCNIKPGDRVGIYLPRCVESVVAVYGILKAGAAFVPLDPLAPGSRSKFLIADCGIRLLITANSQIRKLTRIIDDDTSLDTVIGIDRDPGITHLSWSEVYETPVSDIQYPEINPDDLAYIMYTSGSTGTPKGIMHTHRSGLNYALLSARLYNLGFRDRVAGHAPLHFDISTFSYFTAPLAGAGTVIIPEAFIKVPASLSSLLEKEKITFWYSVPLALIQLLSGGLLDQRDLSSIRWVLFGGEVFAPKYLRELMKLWPGARFCNVYGPAEINQCTYFHIESPPEPDEQIPLGKIWFDASYKILDRNDQEIKNGEVGELVVQTGSMMKGYWNKPELTRRSLFRTTRQVYYRTGDLVTRDEKGNLIFQGRNDRQVKIRGYRVEMDEVEAVLAKHEKVKEAATFLLEENGQSGQLGAAVIPAAGFVIDDMELFAYCKDQLPAYAVPGIIKILPEFPRTSSGKIKRSEIVNYIK